MNICIRILPICFLAMLANADIDEVHMTCDLDLKENVLGDLCREIFKKRYDVKAQVMAGYLLEAQSLFHMTQTQFSYENYTDLECEGGIQGLYHPDSIYYDLKAYRCYKYNNRELFLSCLAKMRRLISDEMLRNPRKYLLWIKEPKP